MNKQIQRLPIFKEPSTLEEAAFSINQLGKNMAEHAFLIGGILCWVKSKLPHGEFMAWMEENVWFRKSAAENFMRFTTKCIEAGLLLEEPHYLYVKIPKFGNIESPDLPQGKFNVIYADPPWQYSNTGFRESPAWHYPTMSIEDICALPVQSLVEEKAILFLWTTSAFLREGLAVCEAWGFDYKTTFVWIKNRGPRCGWYTRSKHELMFVATRGEGMYPVIRPDSYFEAKVRGYTQKPDLVYSLIESMYPGPYIELFATQEKQGWNNWGYKCVTPQEKGK
ncbi:hypothetical protein ES707_06707 [subsurface metagenome]